MARNNRTNGNDTTEAQDQTLAVDATLDVTRKLPANVDKPETEEEVLARYGKHAGQIPAIMLAAADATRIAAKKLVEESAAGVQAAEDILRMLQAEHQQYASEVLRHSENVALRLTEYLTRCHVARQQMVQHRESIIEVAQQVANQPVPNGTNGETTQQQ